MAPEGLSRCGAAGGEARSTAIEVRATGDPRPTRGSSPLSRLFEFVVLTAGILVFLIPGCGPGSPYRSGSGGPLRTTGVVLVLESWGSLVEEEGYLVARGEVTNVSSRKLHGVTALVRFYDAEGQVALAQEAYLDDPNLDPGTTTSFRLEIIDEAVLDSSSVVFRQRDGLQLPTRPRR